MSIDRRTFLKSAACSLAGLTLTKTAAGHPSFAPTACKCVSILLHGLFFLEVQEDTLYAVAPTVTGHKGGYFMRNQGMKPLRVSGTQYLKYLKGSHPDPTFPEALLRFKKDEIHHPGPFFIDSTALDQYELSLILPIPNYIRALRKGDYGKFDPQSGNVESSIRKNHTSSSEVPLILSLEYDLTDVGYRVLSFHAEHPKLIVTKPDVNLAFHEAQSVFPFFDLQVNSVDPGFVPCDDDEHRPAEVMEDDEKSIYSVLNHLDCVPPGAKLLKKASKVATSIQVATCPQFGVL